MKYVFVQMIGIFIKSNKIKIIFKLTESLVVYGDKLKYIGIGDVLIGVI